MRDLPATDSMDAQEPAAPKRKRNIPFSLPFPLARRNLPFWRGFFVGVVILLPLVALALWQACRVLAFDADIPTNAGDTAAHATTLVACLRSTALFGGLACALTSGSMGRAVWFRSMRLHPATTLLLTILATAIAGIALGIIGFTALGLPLAARTYSEMAAQSLPLVWRAALAGTLGGVAMTWLCRAPRPAALPTPPLPRTAASIAARRNTAAKRRKKQPVKRPRR